MCGIAGYLEVGSRRCEREMAAIARAMASAVAHRGPDGDGVWCDVEAGVALAHRRLAVIDPSSAGAQPMLSEHGRYVLNYNGEIYNFRRLRTELEGLGCRFRGNCDSEVLLAAVERWGVEAALPRVDGMFALAIWDRQERTLHLARDRFGIKPLYWGRAGGALIFGSELKALRSHPDWDGTIDPGSIDAYFRFACIPAPYTIYRSAWKLPPASHLSVGPGPGPGAEPEVQAYWCLGDAVAEGLAEPFDGPDEDAVSRLEERVRESVRDHLVADVPVGVFLSGGVDSATVAAIGQTVSRAPLHTFSVGFGDAETDESAAAARIAAHLRTRHTTFRLTPQDCVDAVAGMTALYDEPFADPSQIPTYLLCRQAREHVTVALAGDGGDELFGGYHRYLFADRLTGPRAGMLGLAGRAMAPVAAAMSADRWDRLAGLLPGGYGRRVTGRRLHKAAALYAGGPPMALYEALHDRWPGGSPPIRNAGPRHPLRRAEGPLQLDVAGRLQLFDMQLYLPDDVLTKVDRASMAVSLEVRVPLLDRRVAELAFRLPPTLKWRSGRGKWLLRQVLGRHVPEGLVDRGKTGFNAPVGSWLRGPLRGWAEALLSERALSRVPWLDGPPIRAQWAQHCSGHADRADLIWPVLMLQAWLQDQRNAPAPGVSASVA